MLQAQRALQQLRAALQQRSDRIRRGAALTQVTFGPVSSSGFDVIATWVDKSSQPHSLKQTITSQSAFNYSGTRPPRLRQTPCRFADDIIRAILRKRGVIK